MNLNIALPQDYREREVMGNKHRHPDQYGALTAKA